MHRRNPYRHPPDFELLATSYPPLRQHVVGRTIDFKDDAAQRRLTEALLFRDFGLTVYLPPDRLCPPVPNRLNYVLWIQDIVHAHTTKLPQLVHVHGLDIGTGASAIYPLLACTLEPAWTFVATEIDPESYTHALRNVQDNGLAQRVRVVKAPIHREDEGEDAAEEDTIETTFNFDCIFDESDRVGGAASSLELARDLRYDKGLGPELKIEFTMCNPPFYANAAEVHRSVSGWQRNAGVDKTEAPDREREYEPAGICTGSPVEMITPGGEVRFVCAMIRESVKLQNLEAGGGDEAELMPGTIASTNSTSKSISVRTVGRKRRKIVLETETQGPISPPSPESSQTCGLPSNSIIFKSERAPPKLKSRWYTSMLGKLSSVMEVVDALRTSEISNYAITEFVQGQTRRWAVGWSFGPFRLPDSVSRIEHPNPTLQRLMPPRNTLRLTLCNAKNADATRSISPPSETCLTTKLDICVPSSSEPRASTSRPQCEAIAILCRVLESMEGVMVEYRDGVNVASPFDLGATVSSGISPTVALDTGSRGGRDEEEKIKARGESTEDDHNAPHSLFLVRATRDTWSRSARRKRVREGKDQDRRNRTVSGHDERQGSAEYFICSVRYIGGWDFEFQWVYGCDRGLFESFVSHVRRRVESAVQ